MKIADRTIALTRVRDLDLAVAPAPGRPLHLSAASGLACIHSYIYVIADDELHLGVFRSEPVEPGGLIRLFDGALPGDKPGRKKQKPDLEALTLLPPHADFPHGALLVLGSGSKNNRRRGALLGLDPHGAVRSPPRVIDLSPLLGSLEDAFPKLNIEGAVVSGNMFSLFQRGNKRHRDNAIIRFPLPMLLDALRSRRSGTIKPSAVIQFDLGQIDGVPLCFTDAAALPDGSMVFAAVAESTDNSYDDGPCVGAAIGMIDNQGRLLWTRRLEPLHKIEGVDARADGNVIKLLLATDADDPDHAASLFSATISG